MKYLPIIAARSIRRGMSFISLIGLASGKNKMYTLGSPRVYTLYTLASSDLYEKYSPAFLKVRRFLYDITSHGYSHICLRQYCVTVERCKQICGINTIKILNRRSIN